MGYEIHCTESDFRIPRPRAALEALREADRERPIFDWREVTEEIQAATTLAEALEACCFEVELSSDDKIEKLFYEGKLLTELEDMARLFTVLAPYVKTGSFLDFHDAEGNAWRYSFKKERMRMTET